MLYYLFIFYQLYLRLNATNLSLDWKLKKDGKKNLCLPFAGYSDFHFGFRVHLPLVKGVFGASGINTIADSPTNDAKLLTLEKLWLCLLIIKYSLPVGT